MSALLYVPVAIVLLAQERPAGPGLLYAVGAGLLSSVVPYAADLIALRRVPPRFFGLFMSVHPVLAAPAGLVLPGQHLRSHEWAGIVVNAAAVGFGSRLAGPDRPAETSGPAAARTVDPPLLWRAAISGDGSRRERVKRRTVVAFRMVTRHDARVPMPTRDLVTTGQAAILLRSSRAYVVDLCLRGLLPYVRIGGQRRIRRADVEAMIQPSLTREQLQSLWLHRAVAGKVVANPPAVLAAAEINLRRLRRLHPEGRAWEWLDRWDAVLEEGVEAVLDALTSSASSAVELRCNSPFAGVLSEEERRVVMEALAASRRDHARQMRPEQLEQVLRSV